jgi:hypothetical protein
MSEIDDKRAHYLQVLIDELKKTKTSNRKLDEAIALIAGYKRVVDEAPSQGGSSEPQVSWIQPRKAVSGPLPKFTHSIDMARRFVEIVSPKSVAGCSWEHGAGSAQINTGPRIEAHTPAIALCIAGVELKLRQHMKRPQEVVR